MAEAPQGRPDIPRQREELSHSREAYRKAWEAKTITPAIVTSYFSSLWSEGERKGVLKVPVIIPPLPHSQEELTALREQNKGVVLIPEGMSVQQIARMFDLPMLHSFWQSENLTDIQTQGGWFEVEMDRTSPFKGKLDAEDARALLENQGKRGMRLVTYLISSLVSKDLTGSYLDEQKVDEMGYGPSLTRLLGTVARSESDLAYIQMARHTAKEEPTGDIQAQYVDDTRRGKYGIEIKRVVSPLDLRGVRSERLIDDPEPERVEGGDGYKWVDATTATLWEIFKNEGLHPVHALIIPPGESDEARQKRQAIITEIFSNNQQFAQREFPSGNPTKPSFLVFSWKEETYPFAPDRNYSGRAGYRAAVKKFLREVNPILKDAGLPQFPFPLPIRAEMTEQIDTSGSQLVVPKPY